MAEHLVPDPPELTKTMQKSQFSSSLCFNDLESHRKIYTGIYIHSHSHIYPQVHSVERYILIYINAHRHYIYKYTHTT